LTRKPVAVAYDGDDAVLVIADDGTIWSLIYGKRSKLWQRLPDLPQPEDDE